MINRRQLIENLCKLAFACSLGNLIFYLWIGYQSAVLICLYGMISSMFVYLLMRYKKSTEAGAHFYCFSTFIFFFLFIITSGGINSPILPWLIMVPVVSFQIHEKRNAFIWTSTAFVAILFFSLCSYKGYLFHNELPDEYKETVYIISTSSLVFFSIFSTIIYRDVNKKMLQEIASLTKAEEEQRASIHYWIKGQEAERKRVALDIHDGIAQMIVSTRFKLALYKKDKNNDTSLTDMDRLLEDTLLEIKNITNELHPKSLELSGLYNAVEQLVEEIKRTNGIKVVLTMDDSIKTISSNVSLHLFRIVQESIKNITLHARAKEVKISLQIEDGLCILKISDDGVGFMPENEKMSNSNGLFHIKERVNYLKGKLQVDSKENTGTTILIHVPYEE